MKKVVRKHLELEEVLRAKQQEFEMEQTHFELMLAQAIIYRGWLYLLIIVCLAIGFALGRQS